MVKLIEFAYIINCETLEGKIVASVGYAEWQWVLQGRCDAVNCIIKIL